MMRLGMGMGVLRMGYREMTSQYALYILYVEVWGRCSDFLKSGGEWTDR